MLEIEFEPSQTSECDCCGKSTTRLTRFVNRDGNAFAIYYARFSEGHPDKGLDGIVSIGDWGEDDIPPNRVAFAFHMWLEDRNYNVGITNAAESPWAKVEIIGRKLNRDEALAHEWLSEVFHLTDHMTTEDQEIRTFFGDETIH
jgi:hypothetical protein